jgi:nucleoside-diphosphate-sugar epimerase
VSVNQQIPVVFASSFQVYPNGWIVDESTEPNPQTTYGKTKLEAELILSKASFPVTIARISNVFGIGCHPFYNSVVATWMHLAVQGQTLHADEHAYRDVIWVEDAVRFLIFADNPGIVHVASGRLTPLVDIATQIAEWAGVDMIRYDRGETGPVWYKPQVVTPVFEALRIYWDAVKHSAGDEGGSRLR